MRSTKPHAMCIIGCICWIKHVTAVAACFGNQQINWVTLSFVNTKD